MAGDTPGAPPQEPPNSSPIPPGIKAEPEDGPTAPTSTSKDIIDLTSDDEGEIPSTTKRPRLGSPFQGRTDTHTAPNLGRSMLMTKPRRSVDDSEATASSMHERLREKQREIARETAKKLREPQNQQQTPAFEKSRLFVTESEPGTPDAAQEFLALKRATEEKRRVGNLNWKDEIRFDKAEAAEQSRLLKQRSDQAYDMLQDDEDDEGERESPNIASYSDEDIAADTRSKQRGGNKPPAPPSKTAHPKKRRRAEDMNDILEKARRKNSSKVEKGKGKGKVKAKDKERPKPKGTAAKGRKKRSAVPDLLNMASLRGTNVFEDTARNRDLPDQPTFDPTCRKDTALKSLISSVPDDCRPIAKVDKKYLDDAMKDFTGHGSVTPAEDGNWNVKGMKATLKHYQILGVAFMKRREAMTREPRGGILADDMGLGKTISMLTVIVNGLPLQQKKCRTTLVVASPALVGQWRREIQDKVHRRKDDKWGIGRVKEYSTPLKSNEEVEELEDCDIVLTTYHMVMRSYPRAEAPPQYITAASKVEWWSKHFETHRGALHRIKFHRIILDEAQAIKNPKCITSMACRALNGKHNWAISGTPVLNNINEFYSIFKFIKEPHTGSLKLFKENFCDPGDPTGLTKLEAFLNKVMIRRTHLDTLFNARLLSLPQPHEEMVWLEFNEVERNVYEIVKSRFVEHINCISAANQLDKQYGHIFAMLTCLRQLTSHLLIAQGAITDLLERSDFERLWKISCGDLSEESTAILQHLREKLKESNGNVKQLDTREGATIMTETEMMPTHHSDLDLGSTQDVGGRHGLNYRFDRYLEQLLNSESWEAVVSRTLCSGCRQPPLDPHVTSCFHIYCHACLHDLQLSFARRAMERHRCSECGTFYTSVAKCQASLDRFAGAHETISGSVDGEGLSLTGKSKKQKRYTWIKMNGEVLPSAKTIAFKAQIMNWLEEDPDVKIIVYSLWLPMLHLLGRICQTEGWSFEKYTGNMSHDAREKAIQNFGDPERKTQILLASLKCGGLGLNLTMASRVLSLDLYWNRAIEQQAFCRVFRIGQQKETRMARMCIKNTIDAAIYALQGSKQEQIDAAMDETKRKEKFNVNELMRLFGPVGHDGNGKPFIFAHEAYDNDDDDDSNAMRSPPRPVAERESHQEIDLYMDDD